MMKDGCRECKMTFAEFCEEFSDTPLLKYQKHMCDVLEEKYRKDGNLDSCIPVIRGGGPRSTLCAQLIAIFSFYLEYVKESEEVNGI